MSRRTWLTKLQPLRYNPTHLWKVSWARVETPWPYHNYWEVWYAGRHVGDLFQGKTGAWIGIVFGKARFQKNSKSEVASHIVGLVTNPNN